jgi:hypothetical protein
MKKIFCMFLFVCLVSSAYAQKVHVSDKRIANDTIVWHQNEPLKFTDFNDKPHGAITNEGLACTGIVMYPEIINGKVNYYVKAIFVKSKSFMRDNSYYILEHEQLHFDIAEIYARLLREKLPETDLKKAKNTAQKIYDDLEHEEAKYDNETQHSINHVKQQEWEDALKKQLLELDKYSAEKISMTK